MSKIDKSRDTESNWEIEIAHELEFFCSDKNVLRLIVLMVAQLCENTKKHFK